MFAVAQFAGHQYKLEEGRTLHVNYLGLKTGDKLEVKNVLLLEKDGKISVSTTKAPLKAIVEVEVLSELVRDEKIHIFKKTRRTNYRRYRGHRQDLTLVKVVKINAA